MHHIEKRYIIGIDLGTTNCAVSYVDLLAGDESKERIRIFKIKQLTGAGEFSGLPVLPSFLYIPGKYDISGKDIKIPWKTKNKNFVGAFARDHGVNVPARLVSSAKSWLCHSNADRRAKILPWGAGDEIPKVSPVEATAAYLDHIKMAWNSTKKDDDELYLENQYIIITVPASFDEVARDLTLEGARLAGLNNVTLLEEPLAAFYSWLDKYEKSWQDHVNPGELILVCDVGGGTTDFTLISLKQAKGGPGFERIAVGDHLILGGDNVDLALARHAESKMAKGKKKASLSGDRWKTVCHQCRKAKEMVLEGQAEKWKISLMGKGKKLIAGTLSTDLNKDEIEKMVLEGFFPLADPAIKKKGNIKKGITEFGLPYEPEPAITKHVGWFLENHIKDVKNVLDRDNPVPDLVLFNGGSLKPKVIRNRIIKAISHWFGLKKENYPKALENPYPDLAVARGAAYYGLVKIGQGVKVGSGSARSYYLGVKKSRTGNNESSSKVRHAVCLVERGVEEGTMLELTQREFDVLTNQPVRFELYSSSFRSGDKCGDIVKVDDTLTLLPPLQTVIKFGKKGAKKTIPVNMEAIYTEVGTLSVFCRSAVSNHKWQLRFQLRSDNDMARVAQQDVLEDKVVKSACNLIKDTFGKKGSRGQVAAIVKDIVKITGLPKEKWPLTFIRDMADELLKYADSRGIKKDVEARWLNLVGFCLRPGLGDGFDSHRIAKLWKIYKSGPVHGSNVQVRSEWWIMWRRVAGGLKPGHQRQFIQDILSVMVPGKKGRVKVSPQERLEIWMAVANMERLIVKDKIRWGRMLVSEISPKKSRPQHFWAISRIGARELLYGSVDRVVPPSEVSDWIYKLISIKWEDPRPVCAAVAHMARKTGDRTRDLGGEDVEKIKNWFSQYDFSSSYIKIITDFVPIKQNEESVIFGESLPSGILLRS